MSNVPSATSCFRDIQTHSLSELLTSVLHATSPLGSTLVPALDKHLDQVRPSAACKRGDVIEVQGPAASGKSHLLYYLLLTCVLPPSHSLAELSGWGKAAVLLDTDHKFDPQRFGQLLRSRVSRLLPLNPAAVEAITTKALDLLHVFRPTSSLQLAATIQHLPMYLATNLPDVDLGLLALDSITAFYWANRYAQEQTRSGNHNRSVPRPQNPVNHVLVALRCLAQSHGPLILITSRGFTPSPAAQNPSYPETSVAASHLDTDRQGQPLLPVSCRISVASSSPTSKDRGTASDGTTTDIFPGATCLLGTVRTPGLMQITQFRLHITEDDIVACST